VAAAVKIIRYYFKRFEVDIITWSDRLYTVEFIGQFESEEKKREFISYYEANRETTVVCSIGGLGYDYYGYFFGCGNRRIIGHGIRFEPLVDEDFYEDVTSECPF